jgi:ribosome hibernation promoting factor
VHVQIRGRNIDPTEALRAHVERRLQFALSHFGERIGLVTVRLVDINGPRGGDDKSCRVDVRLRPSGNVFVEDVKADLYAAIDRAAERAGRSVSHELDRSRVRRGHRQAPQEQAPTGSLMVRE